MFNVFWVFLLTSIYIHFTVLLMLAVKYCRETIKNYKAEKESQHGQMLLFWLVLMTILAFGLYFIFSKFMAIRHNHIELLVGVEYLANQLKPFSKTEYFLGHLSSFSVFYLLGCLLLFIFVVFLLAFVFFFDKSSDQHVYSTKKDLMGCLFVFLLVIIGFLFLTILDIQELFLKTCYLETDYIDPLELEVKKIAEKLDKKK